jgi:salicylate hydroxylase
MLKRVILGKAFEQRFGASYRVTHRADLLHALLGIVRGKTNIELATGREVRSAEGNPGGVAVSFPDGSRKKGEMLIACDGIHSALRRTVYPHSKPRDSGLLLYRALLPAILVPREIDQEVVTLWLRPGGHTVHYAVSGGRNFSIVHVCPSPPKGGAKCPIVLPPIADLVPELASLLAEPEDWLAWPGLDLDPLPHWRAPWGLFLGDAAHASLPFLAQGAAMALEDAATLAKHLVSDMSIGPVFEERRARTARIQRQSRQQARIYHAQGIKRLARNTVMAAMSDEMFMNRLAWIYDWQA